MQRKRRLSVKQKRSIKRKVDLELGIKPPYFRIHKSKKVYKRKSKYKRNHEEDN